MKKGICAVVMAMTLGFTAFFAVLTGGPFVEMLSGPVPVTGSFEEVSGSYVAYEVSWPLVSYGAEYYSGDPDRISKWGYVMYDEERQEFFNIVVPEQDHTKFHHLLSEANRSEEDRAKLTPVTIEGTLVPVEDSGVEELLRLLAGNDSKSTREMDVLASSQEGWYSIESKSIQGFGRFPLWLCAVTAGINLLIFLVALTQFLKREPKESEEEILGKAFAGSKLDQLLMIQRVWLNSWTAITKTKNRKMAALAVIGGLAVPTAIGYFVGASMTTVMTIHLPLGILFGDLYLWVQWMTERVNSTEKTITAFRRRIGKLMPSGEEREAMAADVLEAAREQAFRERSKDRMTWVAVGRRYWAVFSSNKTVQIVDSARVAKVETSKESYQIPSGRVTVTFTNYAAKIYFKDSTKKKGCDEMLAFDAENTLGFLVTQIKKYTGDSIEIVSL
ncbi:MAG: hypothetical protein HFG75_05035 [Hungatella sp.]|nr:hypothetical protein [Hungatella sp.]